MKNKTRNITEFMLYMSEVIDFVLQLQFYYQLLKYYKISLLLPSLTWGPPGCVHTLWCSCFDSCYLYSVMQTLSCLWVIFSVNYRFSREVHHPLKVLSSKWKIYEQNYEQQGMRINVTRLAQNSPLPFIRDPLFNKPIVSDLTSRFYENNFKFTRRGELFKKLTV